MGEGEVVEAFRDAPITQDRIETDLERLGVTAGAIVLVHTRMSSLGWVCGGPITVIRALQSRVRSYGTLVMPAHSGDLSDPELWENPPVPRSWWSVIRETMPAFDPESTPTRGVGVVPELFRTLPDVMRSRHPHVSFAAWGEHAVDIVSDHELEFSLGERSPLARVYDLDGWVLLLGAGFDTNTSFHLSEYRAEYARKERVILGAPLEIEGHRRWKTFTDINYNSDDFGAIGAAFVHARPADVRQGKVGNAASCLFRQRLAVDFGARWMHTHRR